MASKSALSSRALSRLASLSGIFAVDKPAGVTSAKVVALLKAALVRDLRDGRGSAADEESNVHLHEDTMSPRAETEGRAVRRKLLKIGHGGTLDMNATGVLVIACGTATKKLTNYLRGEKVYIAEGRLGSATDTMDASGREVETAAFGHVTKSTFSEALSQFTGDILQVPPVYSALKVGGKRMSDLAARGVEVEPKPARPIRVFSVQCHHFSPPDFQIEVHCGGGVYIRKLIHDIGKSLDTCAHMRTLCRTKQGSFTLDGHALPQDRWTLEDILQALQEFDRMESAVR